MSNLHKNLCCGCSLEAPRRGDSNEHHNIGFYEEISKIITKLFLLWFISEYLLNHGVDCFHDNIKLVTMSHIVFLCVLPSQIPAICEEIKSCVAPTLFIYSFASSCPVKKLRQLLGTTNVVRPDYIMSEEQDTIPWDYSLNVQKALEIKEIVSLTYPLSREKGENSFIY